MKELAAFALELNALRSILLATHISPDSDAIGSTCALALGLEALGKRAVVYLPEGPPSKHAPLVTGIRLTDQVPQERFSAVVVVDNATRRRLGPYGEQILALGERTFNLDHHVSNERFAQFNLVVPESASSAELVFALLKEIGAPISAQMANLLLAGVMEDTGSFRFSNATALAFEHAAALIALGADPNRVAGVLYFNVPHRVLKLKALALSTLELLFAGRVALICLSKQMMIQAGARQEDAEGLVDDARSVEGALIAVLLREVDDGWKASLRSKDERIDVNLIAAHFGGGGHRPAAGCTIHGALSEVRAALEPKLEAAILI